MLCIVQTLGYFGHVADFNVKIWNHVEIREYVPPFLHTAVFSFRAYNHEDKGVANVLLKERKMLSKTSVRILDC